MLSHRICLLLSLCAFLFLEVSAVPAGPALERRGKKKRWCSVDTSNGTPTDWAMTPGWQASMLNCLRFIDYDGWGSGKQCAPVYPVNSTDYNPRPQFYMWKAHSYNFHDGHDCYQQNIACLEKGIRAGLAETTESHYQVKNGLISHTCEMGFDYGVELTPRKNVVPRFNPNPKV